MFSTNYILFYIVVLLCNIMHGITGFAGTIMAMPFGIMLVGYDVAKPILNVLAIISGFYIVIGDYKQVNWKELIKIVVIMAFGIFGGIFIKNLFAGKEQILYKTLGIFVIALALQGLWKSLKKEGSNVTKEMKEPSPLINLILIVAGIVHGIFVAGGPLLTSYMTKKIYDKEVFRATISTVWVFLNTLILFSDIQAGYWTRELIIVQLITIPFLLLAMWIGSMLVKRMSQAVFMKITYILLIVSGISLFVK